MKTPQLRLHASTGTYYARYWHEGRDRFQYFTRDRRESEAAFAAWLPTWSALKISRPSPPRSGLTVVELAERWLTHIEITRGRPRMVQYRSAVAHFVHIAGEVPARAITLADLEALAADLRDAEYRPRSINAYVRAAKRMLSWAGRRKLIPPPDLADLRLDKPPRPTPAYASPAQVRAYITRAARQSVDLGPWLSLIYLTCARPSEVYRLIHAHHGQRVAHRRAAAPAELEAPGRFLRLPRERRPVAFETTGKTEGATGQLRVVPLSAEALEVLEAARPCFSLSWFLALAHRATSTHGAPAGAPRGAKVLRSWGASELRARGVSREDIRRILGHATSEPIDHYVAESLGNLRALVSRLTLQRGPARAGVRVMKARGSKPADPTSMGPAAGGATPPPVTGKEARGA